MNHYERLKVTQDAPPEVIRAAYRTLANRLHPDRQVGGTDADGASHDQMALLNAAYEVLIDPVLRRDYDATLAPVRVSEARPSREAARSNGIDGAAASAATAAFGAGDSQLERPWLGVSGPVAKTSWAPGPRHIYAGAGVGAILMVIVAAALWQLSAEEHPLDRTLSAEVARQPGVGADDVTPSGQPAMATAAAGNEPRRPTVEELSRMSDEELVKALPALDGRPAPRTQAAGGVASGQQAVARGPHMLDGAPIRLRVETHLVDPLAPTPTSTSGSSDGVKVTQRLP